MSFESSRYFTDRCIPITYHSRWRWRCTQSSERLLRWTAVDTICFLMSGSRMTISRTEMSTVQKIYPTAVPLLEYVLHIANCHENLIVCTTDPLNYQRFLRTSVIVPSDKTNNHDALFEITKESQSSSSIRDFLNRFIAQLVKLNLPYREQNCLSYGYRSKTSHSDCGMRSNAGLECYFVNTLHSIVTAPVWQLFLSRVGESS